MTVERAMEESLVYERAFARTEELIQDVCSRKREDGKIDKENGEKPDKSYDVLVSGLRSLQSQFRKESNRLWAMAESKAEFYDWAFEKLANAIIFRAVEDYEIAISGHGNSKEKLLIERFAEQCDNGEAPYTNLKVGSLLDIVCKRHEEFKKIANENGKEIIAETKAHRAAKVDLHNNTYRCPLCGGALYSYSQLGVHRVCCTGCCLSEIVKVDKKKKL